MLEALEVEPAQEAGIFVRVACSVVVDPELANYAVQVLGMGKERKEFVLHLCAPQEPGRCEETGAALHCGEWAVVPGGAGRGVDGESAETSAKTGRGLRPEIAEAGPALFGPMDGERLGAQLALADELGLDPPARPMEPRRNNARRSPQLGSTDGDATARGEVRGSSGGKTGVESRMSRDMFPSPAYGITRKIERGAGATRTEAPRPEMVAPSVGREGTRVDCRHFCNGGAGQSAQEMPHREPRGHGQEESRRARTRKQEERKIVLKRANSGVLQQRRGPWERRRVRGEVDRCHEARSATPFRLGHDAAPPGAASRGLRSGGRGASERSGGCLSRYSSEAECWEQAQLRGPTRVAVVSGSRGFADARPSGECERRSDPEIPRSGGGVTGRRRMVSRTPSRSVARSGSVVIVVWSSGSGGEGRTGSSPAAPGSVETEPTRGERAAPCPRPALEERGRRRGTPTRSAKRLGGRKMGKERPPEGSAVEQPGQRRSERPKQGKAKQVAVAGAVAPLVVCGAQRASLAEGHLGKELPPHSVHMERSWGLPWYSGRLGKPV